MDVREELREALQAERAGVAALDAIRAGRILLANRYYSELYGVEIGSKIRSAYLVANPSQRVLVTEFVPMSDDPDDKPGIVGRLLFRFGVDDKVKNLLPKDWSCDGEAEIAGNRKGGA